MFLLAMVLGRVQIGRRRRRRIRRRSFGNGDLEGRRCIGGEMDNWEIFGFRIGWGLKFMN